MSLRDSKIIVTGGPTREWIDPVRYISNASSGKMGVALADAAHAMSGDTVFIHGPMDRSLLEGRPYRIVGVESTEELLGAVINELSGGAVLIMAAAPADYRPAERATLKIKKKSDALRIDLVRNPDILKTVASRKAADPSLAGLFVVGFAAETHDVEAYALSKLEEKDLDMICLNDVAKEGAGFSADTNIVVVFTRGGGRFDFPLMTKKDLAAGILEKVEIELAAREH
ncbi:MAG: phosphopantothenoylcysteine decarboxylase [Spirochaetes bacterium]|jgi:phosphopantothenoylcysteine decarboxylase/phosphopantothenate--cysteine ligase|nr:phosphopantothenoylcysteine decarboxylase [Spirochaetota bacterium]